MSKILFQAKAAVNSAADVDGAGTWDVNLTITDNVGAFLSTAVQVGDVLVLDTNPWEIGTYTRYIVQTVSVVNANTVNARIAYDPSNDNDPAFLPVDITFANPTGLITRPTGNYSLLATPATGIQQITDDFAEYVSNMNLTNIDAITGGSANVDLSGYVTSTDLTTTLSSYATNTSVSQQIANVSVDLSGYVTSTDLTTTLGDYTTSSDLTTALGNYALSSDLSNYVTTTNLNTTLGNYVTTTNLSTTLGDYTTTADLNTTLGNYALSSDLSNYTTTADLNTTLGNYALSSDLSNYALSSDLSNYVTTTNLNTTLGNYALSSDLSNYVTTASYTADQANLTITESQISDLQSYLTSETVTSLTVNANILTYTNELGQTANIDLSLYIDDTNLARIESGNLDAATGIATFTRDDTTTFTVDFSSLIDVHPDATATTKGIVYGNTDNTAPHEVAIGYNTLLNEANTSIRGKNVAVGFEANRNANTGFFNTSVGYQALRDHTSGNDNSMFGALAGLQLQTGSRNTALGRSAMQQQVNAQRNSAFGHYALSGLDIATAQTTYPELANVSNQVEDNCAIGRQSLGQLWNGTYNTAVGNNVAHILRQGSLNVMIGVSAGQNMTKGSQNTVLGQASGMNMIEADQNTFIGVMSGLSATSNVTATNNIAIGYNARVSTGRSNQISLGDSQIERLIVSGIGLDTDQATHNDVLVWDNTGGFGGKPGFRWQNMDFANIVYDNDTVLRTFGDQTSTGRKTFQTVQTTADVGLDLQSTPSASGYIRIQKENVGLDEATGTSNAPSNRFLMGVPNWSDKLMIQGPTRSDALDGNAQPLLDSANNQAYNWTTNLYADLGHDNAENATIWQFYSGLGGVARLKVRPDGVWAAKFSGDGSGLVNLPDGRPNAAGVLRGHTTSDFNVSVGGLAGSLFGTANTSMSYHTAIGAQAMRFTTNTTNTTAVGYAAFNNTSTVNHSTAIGSNTGAAATTVSESILIGSSAGRLGNAFSRSTHIGNNAAYLATGGALGNERNTGVGFQNFRYMVTGRYNSSLGDSAGYTMIEGEHNVTIGHNSLIGQYGNKNIVIGSQAGTAFNGNANVRVENNIVIGHSAQPSGNRVSNEITLGNYDHNRLRIPGIGVDTSTLASNQVLKWDGTQFVGQNYLPLSNDPYPTLGTDLNANGHNIYSPSALRVYVAQATVDTGNVGGPSLNLTLNGGDALSNDPDPANVVAVAGTVKIDAGLDRTNNGRNNGSVQIGRTNANSIEIGNNNYLYGSGTQLNGPANWHGIKMFQYDTAGNRELMLRTIFDGTNRHLMLRDMKWPLTKGTSGQFLATDGTDLYWANQLGEATPASSGTLIGYTSGVNRQVSLGTSAGEFGNVKTTESTFIGYFAGRGSSTDTANVTGIRNTALGTDALLEYTTGSQNCAFGNNALRNNSTGNSNMAVGLNALRNNVSGSENVAVGTNALLQSTGIMNVAIGSNAMAWGALSGDYNTALGRQSLGSLAGTSSWNVAFGTDSMASLTTGARNVAVGGLGGRTLTSGSDNTFIGQMSGEGLVTGDNNIFVGYFSQPPVNVSVMSNTITIGRDQTRLRIPGMGLDTDEATPYQVLMRSANPAVVDFEWVDRHQPWSVADQTGVNNSFGGRFGKVMVDVTAGPITVLAPQFPVVGEEIELIHAAGNAEVNAITINFNGNNHEGSPAGVTINTNRAKVRYVYFDATTGWIDA